MTISASPAAAPSWALVPAIAGPSTSRSSFHTARPSPPLEPHNLKLREGESIFKTAVFLGSMIVVALLLLVLICMARWDNIVSLVPLFNSDAASVAAAGGRRWRWSRRRPPGSDAQRRQGSTRQRQQQLQQLQYDVESFTDEQQPALSNSLGKKNRSHNKRMVEALPVISYASAAAASSPSLELGSLLLGAECSICLCEFADGDRVRFLPDCCHGFHVECVDVWLIAHASCPSCRNSLHTGAAGSLRRQQQQQQPSTSSDSSILSSSSSTTTSTT